MFWGSWAVALADVQRTFGLSDAGLGVLLSFSIGIAGINGAIMGHHAERWGTARMLTVALAAWAVMLVAAGAAPELPAFVVAFAAAEVAGGSVDTAMNASATKRLQGQPGALVRFHALFNSGALCGAAAAGLLLHAGVSWRWLWPGLAVGVAALSIWSGVAARHSADDEETIPPAPAPVGRPATRSHPLARIRAEGLLLFLFIFAIAEVVEGGVDTWGVLYLRTELAAGVLLGAGAYVIGQGVAATTRGAGGPLLGRFTARRALIIGSSVAAVGIFVESTAGGDVVAAAGLAAGAAGASLFWPLVMSEAIGATRRPTATVGAFTAAGYVGWVAGAPVIGFVADTWGLNRGLQVLAAMACLVTVFAMFHRSRPLPESSGVSE
jgi:predicted MFS family arabinose efflux permease